jgi:acyl phosphate:glycerol-3-phosphate acyltransferase
MVVTFLVLEKNLDPTTSILIVLGCYCIGAFSFARTAVRLFAAGKDIENIQIQIPGTNQTMRYTSLGGSAAGIILGRKVGAITGMLDMLKVILPIFVLRLVFPTLPEYMLIGTAAATIGHIFPLFYRFKGGGGYSTIFGGLLIITPIGAMVCSIAGMTLGLLVFRSFPLLYALQLLLIVPWMAFRFGEASYIIFAVVVNILFFITWIPPARAALKAGKTDHTPTLREMMQPYPMGVALINWLEKIHFNID